MRLAPGPTPGWDQPLLLVPATVRPATRRRLPADRRCSLGQRDRDRLPNGGFPHAASLLATAALSGGGCPFFSSFVSAWSTHKGWGVPGRVGWSCGTPKLERQAGGWGWCLSWCSPCLCCAYLWGLGEGETHLQRVIGWLSPSRAGGIKGGSVPPRLPLWLRRHSWIQQALCEPLPWDMLALSVSSPSCFTQAGSLLPTVFGLPHGP